jgi:hypothetical protein
MNTKPIFVAMMAAVFVISMAAFAEAKNADNGNLDITDITVDGDGVWITVSENFHSGAPQLNGVAVTLDNGGFLAITSHGGAFDHAKQGNAQSPVYHVHYLEADAAGGDCPNSGAPLKATYEEDLGSILKIKNNMIHVTDVNFSDTAGGSLSEATSINESGLSFVIHPEDFSTAVCFTPVDTFDFP